MKLPSQQKRTSSTTSTALTWGSRLHSAYRCISFNKPVFTSPLLALEFFPTRSQQILLGRSFQELAKMWDMTILLHRVFLQKIYWNLGISSTISFITRFRLRWIVLLWTLSYVSYAGLYPVVELLGYIIFLRVCIKMSPVNTPKIPNK